MSPAAWNAAWSRAADRVIRVGPGLTEASRRAEAGCADGRLLAPIRARTRRQLFAVNTKRAGVSALCSTAGRFWWARS